MDNEKSYQNTKKHTALLVGIFVVLATLLGFAFYLVLQDSGASDADVRSEIEEVVSNTYDADSLAEFDGTDGNDCYVAYENVVYDFSASDRFEDGKHGGEIMCGLDTTGLLADAPHGKDVVDGFPIVGIYVGEAATETGEALPPAMTVSELAAYDGLEGNNCYVALYGQVYDVTESETFSEGVHFGETLCGKVGDGFMADAPHGADVFEGFEVVALLTTGESSSDDEFTFTLEELAAYDGKDGNDCYVAYEGDVYDFTSSERFEDGKHAGEEMCGLDTTGMLEGAPHGTELFEGFDVVGTLGDR